MDRTYAHLVTFFHNPSQALSVHTVQALVAHYLANYQSSPTPLAAIVSSSPYTSYHLLEISSAFRNAVHITHQNFKESSGGLFTSTLSASWAKWITAILHGLKGSPPLVHLACSVGLILGLEDIKSKNAHKSTAQDDALIFFAECIDSYGSGRDGDKLATALLFGAHGIQSAPDHKLKLLPLPLLARLLTAGIDAAFYSGSFLSSSKDETSVVNAICQSPTMMSMGSLSKFCARTLSILLSSKPPDGLSEASNTLAVFQSTSTRLSMDWAKSPFSRPETTADDLIKSIWSIFKNLLFSLVMISHECLSATLYLPKSFSSQMGTVTSPQSLAHANLHALFQISFVVSQFGGITSTQPEGSGFPQLQHAFYLSLDILSTDSVQSEKFVTEMCEALRTNDSLPEPMQQSRIAFALACIEQLTPVLSEESIRTHAFSLCQPHLYDFDNKDVFESAHSVVLAIFGLQASMIQKQTPSSAKGGPSDLYTVVQQFVPFFTECLLENSADRRLNLAQLRLAYPSLIRFTATDTAKDQILTRYCIEQLISRIHSLSLSSQRRHRLQLVLISCISALPLSLLPRVLDEVYSLIISQRRALSSETGKDTAGQGDKELVQALFDEIFQAVGYCEKEFVMKWWHKHRANLSLPEEKGKKMLEGRL